MIISQNYKIKKFIFSHNLIFCRKPFLLSHVLFSSFFYIFYFSFNYRITTDSATKQLVSLDLVIVTIMDHFFDSHTTTLFSSLLCMVFLVFLQYYERRFRKEVLFRRNKPVQHNNLYLTEYDHCKNIICF